MHKWEGSKTSRVGQKSHRLISTYNTLLLISVFCKLRDRQKID